MLKKMCFPWSLQPNMDFIKYPTPLWQFALFAFPPHGNRYSGLDQFFPVLVSPDQQLHSKWFNAFQPVWVSMFHLLSLTCKVCFPAICIESVILSLMLLFVNTVFHSILSYLFSNPKENRVVKTTWQSISSLGLQHVLYNLNSNFLSILEHSPSRRALHQLIRTYITQEPD